MVCLMKDCQSRVSLLTAAIRLSLKALISCVSRSFYFILQILTSSTFMLLKTVGSSIALQIHLYQFVIHRLDIQDTERIDTTCFY